MNDIQNLTDMLSGKKSLLETLANLVETRSFDSGRHIKRTMKLTAMIISRLTETGMFENILNVIHMEKIVQASVMHDIGKITIPEQILLKPGKLTAEEFKAIENHTVTGSEIFKPLINNHNNEYFTYCYEITRYHHENWNGSGYPDRLMKEEIPLSARIVALVDVYDALVSKRCYKKAVDHETALEIIRRETGSHFDPVIVDGFLSIEKQVKNVMALL